MADHTMYIAWAFERHCKNHLNADFEVCDDIACQVAIEFEGMEAKAKNGFLQLYGITKDELVESQRRGLMSPPPGYDGLSDKDD